MRSRLSARRPTAQEPPRSRSRLRRNNPGRRSRLFVIWPPGRAAPSMLAEIPAFDSDAAGRREELLRERAFGRVEQHCHRDLATVREDLETRSIHQDRYVERTAKVRQWGGDGRRKLRTESGIAGMRAVHNEF